MTPMSGFESRYGELTVRVFPTSAEMARAAARDAGAVLRRTLDERGEANAMFATGNSQLEMLTCLVALADIAWGHVRVFHMDEYIGLADDHPASFRRYIRTRLADVVHPLEAHYVGGPGGTPDEYSALLRAHPLDLCVMGIGENGHLAFNDPPVADFDDPLDVKVVNLDEACRRQQVGEGHFATVAEVPAQAITVTIPALLRAHSVVVVCPEERKAAPVAAALTGPVTTDCPASILRRCSHARLYLDGAAAGLL